MAFEVIEVQDTPNPNARKFMLDRPVTDRTLSFLSASAGKGHPLASQLFAVTGVVGLMFLNDFVTVSKQPQATWSTITSKVRLVFQKFEAGA